MGGMWDSTIQVMAGQSDGKERDAAWLREVHIAPRGNADYIITELLDAEVTQVLEAQGGRFLVAESTRDDLQGLALWRGRWHEVSTYLLSAQEGPGADPLEAFDGLRFQDSEDGVVASALPHLRVSVVDVATNVDGVGDIAVAHASDALQFVPSWAGASVQAGEVWRVDTTMEEDTHAQHGFLLAGHTAVLTLTPDEPHDRAQAGPLRFLESVRSLTWSQPDQIGANR